MNEAVAVHHMPGASFPVRHMNFAHSGLQAGITRNALINNWLTTLSAMFPDGEMFFVHSVRHLRDKAKSEQLKKDISAFIGQEAMHAREHASLNRSLTELGYSTAGVTAHVAWLMDKLKHFLSPLQCLALTSAAEHFTAILAKQLMAHEDMQAVFASDEARRIWLWHAIEESEHKAIAMNLYRDAGGGQFLRLVAYIPTSIYMAALMSAGTVWLSTRDPRSHSTQQAREAFHLLLGRNGFISGLWRDYLDYFRLDFHPDDHDTAALEAETYQKLGLDQ
ncbi:MAG: metal-dependent hydrolase [Alcanivoracaceae bacterium]